MSASSSSTSDSTIVSGVSHIGAPSLVVAPPTLASSLHADPPSSSSLHSSSPSLAASSSMADSAKSLASPSPSAPRASSQRDPQPQQSSIGRDNSEKQSSSFSSHRTATSPTAMLQRVTLRDASEQREVHSVAAAAGSGASMLGGVGVAASSSFRSSFGSHSSSSSSSGAVPSSSVSLLVLRSPSPSPLAVPHPRIVVHARSAHAVGTVAESDEGMDVESAGDVHRSSPSVPATAPAAPIIPAASFQQASVAAPAAQQQQQRIVSRGAGAAAESKDEVEARQPVSSSSSSMPIAARLQLLFNRPRAHASPAASASRAAAAAPASSSSSSSSSSARPASAFSSACHCLVVDTQRIEPASPSSAKHTAAVNASDRDRRALTVALLPLVDPSSIAAAYVINGTGGTRQLHINFHSFAALGAALSSHTFLVRCGLQQNKGPWGAGPCGPERQSLPELLELTCEPVRAITADECSKEITAMLAAMGIEHTSISTVRPSVNYRGNQPARIIVTVVPRSILDMREDLVRLHRAHTLFGSEVLVSAPNRADLARCDHCSAIGHQSSACPEFSGVAVRLLLKDPMPYGGMLALVSAAGARSGYLGSTTGEGPPRRVVTLLFDNDESNTTAIDGMMERLGLVIEELRDRLHVQPRIVNTADRERECRECGSSMREHRCEFETGALALKRTIVHQHAQQQQPQQQHQSASSSSSSSPPARAPHAPAVRLPGGPEGAARRAAQVCSQWHTSKKCDRLLQGGVNGRPGCGFAHPADYVISSTPICYNFRDHGRCVLGDTCRFLHGQAAPSFAAPAAVSAPAVIIAPVVFAPAAPAPSAPSASAAARASSSAAVRAAAVPIAAPISILQRPSVSLDSMRDQRVASMAAAESSLSSSSSAPPSSPVHTRARAAAGEQRVPEPDRFQPGSLRQKNKRGHQSRSPPSSSPAPATPSNRGAQGRGGRSNKKANTASVEDEHAAASSPIVLVNRFSGLDSLDHVDDVAAPSSSASSSAPVPAPHSSSSSSSSSIPISSLGAISSPQRSIPFASAGRSMSASSISVRRSISVSQSSSSSSIAVPPAATSRRAAPIVEPAAAASASSSSSSLVAGSNSGDPDVDAAPPSSSPSAPARSSAHDAEME